MTKYRAQPIIIDNHRFHSKREGARYCVLKMLLNGGAISDLVLQPKFKLFVKDQVIESYCGDFSYYQNGKHIVEDVKGFRTRDYKRKKKWMKALYGIEIFET